MTIWKQTNKQTNKHTKIIALSSIYSYSSIQSKSAPKISWLVTKPLSIIILASVAALAYGTLYLGRIEMEQKLIHWKVLHISPTASRLFTHVVIYAFWFSVAAHGLEAAYTYHHTTRTLQLPIPSAMTWASLVFLVGYPIFSEITAIIGFHTQQAAKNKKSR